MFESFGQDPNKWINMLTFVFAEYIDFLNHFLLYHQVCESESH